MANTTVTYRGPSDPLDGTTAVEVDGRTFRRDNPEQGIPAALVDRLKGDDLAGHKFDIQPDRSGGDS